MTVLTFTTSNNQGRLPEAREMDVPYSDALFDKNPAEYQHDLARVSAVMAGSTYTRDSQVAGPGYATENLRALGFKTESHGYHVVDDPNNVAFTLGYKRVGANNLFAVIIRGTPQNAEWSGDFMIGDEDAPGMDNMIYIGQKIAAQLHEFVMQFDNVGQENIFWVTGHSRGGSATEVVGKMLIDAGEERVFAYAFAPTTTYKSADNIDYAVKYQAVHAIINPLDVAPTFPLVQWGFTHIGQQHILPVAVLPEVAKEYERINGGPFKGDAKQDADMLDRGLQLYYALAPSVHDFYHATTPWWDGQTMTPYQWVQDMMMAPQGLEIPERTANVMAYAKTHPVYAKLFEHMANGGMGSYEHTVTTYISFMAVLPDDWVKS
ncbi:lipase family protein [Weissella confusa]|uniref:lipase family protein n=1 Tax=Weissella confusa TaxID=1583 RepID=UPI00223B33F7|nr:lipase family protein [Weissella confusa]MCS9992003.1 lipase [Weissella confusa]MCS9996650.1 lipase [Weissella confusa]